MSQKLVYWGTGNISKMCLEYYPNIRPSFFIDSNWGTGSFYDLQVKNPNTIENWSDLFIVIVTTVFSEIENILKGKGLIKGKHYIDYKGFFEISNKTAKENIVYLEKFIEQNNEYKNPILIIAPVFLSRLSKDMIHFFKEYALHRLPQKCVMLSSLEVVEETYAQSIMGYPTIDMPEICKWDGERKIDIYEDHNIMNMLEKEEEQWICNLESRMVCRDRKLSYRITAEIYWYFKNVFDILQPKKVCIWGGWTRTSHIIAEFAKRNNIPYGFMELGWIPGTFQFDRRGIAGQSEYAVNPERILNFHTKIKNTEINRIRDYITANKIDTGKFRETEEDERKILTLDSRKKTIFFVGMDDYGMGINPQSEYWKQFVCSVFSSTLEAVSFVAEICKKKNWNFIFKPHPNPADKNKLDGDYKGNSIIQVRHMEIDRLIQISDVVVSIASAVDYKTLIYGKPLVQLGHTTLFRKGCSYEVNDVNEIEQKMELALKCGMTAEQNKNFELHMAQLLENYLWDDLTERELHYGLPVEKDFFDMENDI